MPRPIFTVFGATGNQGGSVVRMLLNHPVLASRYGIRAITRNPSSATAKALAESASTSANSKTNPDFELVAADLDDAKSIVQAVKGSSVVFGMTDFWATADPSRETAQGKAVVDAAAAANVDLLIWSSLPSLSQLQQEAVRTGSAKKEEVPLVPHFESKAVVEQYIKSQHPSLSTITFHPAMFWENLSSPPFGPVSEQDESGKSVLKLPLPFSPDTALIPFISPRDVGQFVSAFVLAFESEPDRVKGKQFPVISHLVTVSELVDIVTKAAAGRKVQYERVSMDDFVGRVPEAFRHEYSQNMKLVEKPGYYGSRQAAIDGKATVDKLLKDYDADKLSDPTDFLKWKAD